MIERPDLPEWARTGGWTVAGAVSALWLLGVVLLVVGFLVGAPGGEPAPTVDFDEPTAEVIADATAKFRAGDYTMTAWRWGGESGVGEPPGGIVVRASVENSADEVRFESWQRATATDGVLEPSAPHLESFRAGLAFWVRRPGVDYWRRDFGLDPTVEDGLPFSPDDLRRSSPTVVVDNASALVVRIDDGNRVHPLDRNGTLRMVVTKGPDPHVERTRFTTHRNNDTTDTIIQVSEWGTAEARRPESVPSTTVTEILARTVRGLDRIF